MIYRIDDDLAREQAQWFVVGLGRCSRRRSSCCATTACSSSTATRSPRRRSCCCCCRACPGIGAQVNGAYLGVEHRADLLPARRVREDRHRHLPRGLPARHAPGAGARRAPVPRRDDPAAQALRAAARHLGRGDGDARLHPRPRLVADVLRRASSRCSTSRRTGCRSWRSASALFALGAWFFASTTVGARAGPRRRLARPVRPGALRVVENEQLPDRAAPVRAGRRRAVRRRLRPGAAHPARRRRASCPRRRPTSSTR